MMNSKQYALVVVLAVIAGFGGGVMAGRWPMDQPLLTSKPAKIVRAEAFQLVDSHGATHAALDIQEGGGPGLLFYDSDHEARVVFEMTSKGDPRLFLIDANGIIRAVLGLGLDADGSPFMRLRDENRKILWSIPQAKK
jgi:hypothetical protein